MTTTGTVVVISVLLEELRKLTHTQKYIQGKYLRVS